MTNIEIKNLTNDALINRGDEVMNNIKKTVAWMDRFWGDADDDEVVKEHDAVLKELWGEMGQVLDECERRLHGARK